MRPKVRDRLNCLFCLTFYFAFSKVRTRLHQKQMSHVNMKYESVWLYGKTVRVQECGIY